VLACLLAGLLVVERLHRKIKVMYMISILILTHLVVVRRSKHIKSVVLCDKHKLPNTQQASKAKQAKARQEVT